MVYLKIPEVAFEEYNFSVERREKRHIALHVISIVLLALTNIAWIVSILH